MDHLISALADIEAHIAKLKTLAALIRQLLADGTLGVSIQASDDLRWPELVAAELQRHEARASEGRNARTTTTKKTRMRA